MLSIVSKAAIDYPAEAPFSPSERFAEYRFDHVSSQRNEVYGAIRECLQQASLDHENFGDPSWNPLGRYVGAGQNVFVLCNFVTHRQPGEPARQFQAKCTHGAVVRAVVDYLLVALRGSGSVIIGNAPLQSCRWESVFGETGARAVVDFYASQGVAVKGADLRASVRERSRWGTVLSTEEHEDAGVPIDFGVESLLNEFPQSSRFRVDDYSPKRTESYHSPGRHVYMVSRKILKADVIVSIPKLKTHEKVGVTGAIKGCVGGITQKECLPHHRGGPPVRGGDEYPSDPVGLGWLASQFHEKVQDVDADSHLGSALRAADRILRSGMRRLGGTTAGAWWGNDTAWRMALDVARIFRYAKETGELSTEPVRQHIVFVDGIVGGEGAGPLKPGPVKSGTVLFASDPVTADHACARLMGFDPMRVAVLREARRPRRFSLAGVGGQACVVNGATGVIQGLAAVQQFRPAPGWANRIEQLYTVQRHYRVG